ncbi:hypothetical protein [Bradyrhizobium manausense]|uniref:hypothetical protein n=1 Tax=Bradyrhizobium manausense TaxID=989370 RepID=UPI0007C7645D
MRKESLSILWELQAAEDELIGKTVVVTDGKAGTIGHVHLDEVHGLRISIAGHEGEWQISTVKLIQNCWREHQLNRQRRAVVCVPVSSANGTDRLVTPR